MKRKRYTKHYTVTQLATDQIILHYTCSECGAKSDQPLTAIVENGTHTCECDTDMDLDPTVEVRTPKKKKST